MSKWDTCMMTASATEQVGHSRSNSQQHHDNKMSKWDTHMAAANNIMTTMSKWDTYVATANNIMTTTMSEWDACMKLP